MRDDTEDRRGRQKERINRRSNRERRKIRVGYVKRGIIKVREERNSRKSRWEENMDANGGEMEENLV